MDKDSILEMVKKIMAEVFDIKSDILTLETTQADIEEWDSLEHLRFFLTLEQALNIKFSMEDITVTNSVKDILQLIQKKIK